MPINTGINGYVQKKISLSGYDNKANSFFLTP